MKYENKRMDSHVYVNNHNTAMERFVSKNLDSFVSLSENDSAVIGRVQITCDQSTLDWTEEERDGAKPYASYTVICKTDFCELVYEVIIAQYDDGLDVEYFHLDDVAFYEIDMEDILNG